ncbi:transposase [Collimonas pratensis]|nr:transposase [Collimonas pratensis]
MFLRDDQWGKLEPLMLGRKGNPGVSGRNNRLFIEAVLWHISGKCCWSELPSEFGGWNSVYMRFRRWNQSGCWRQMVDDLRDDQELSGLVKRIAAYAEQQTESAVRRTNRRVERKVYSASVKPAGKENTAPGGSEADAHWLSLVNAA